MARKRWTWTRICPKPCGDSTAPNAPARSIWPRCWPGTTKRGCPLSASTAGTCRMPATRPSRRRAGKAAAVRPGRAGRRHDARQDLSVDGRHLDGHRRLDCRPAFFEIISACASRRSTWSSSCAACDEGIYDPAEFEQRSPGSKANCKKARTTTRRTSSARREQKDSDWESRQDGDDRPRPDDRQSPAGRTGLRRGGAGPQRHRRRFPGPAAVDRSFPQRRFPGSDPQLVVRLERHPRSPTSLPRRTTA